MYKIFLHALGQGAEGEIVTINRDDFSAHKLAYNMAELWAWNIRGEGFESDGPCVFIAF